MPLGIQFCLFAFGNVAVAGAKAQESALRVCSGLTRMFDPAKFPVLSLNPELNLLRNELLPGSERMCIPTLYILRHNDLAKERRIFFEILYTVAADAFTGW